MSARALTALAMMFASGCLPGAGECDERAATELAYDEFGTPAFVGQALVVESCAAGFCHASGIEPEKRNGAPAGLDYDVATASTGDDLADLRSVALRAAQFRILQQYGMVLDQVRSGQMPPGGHAWDDYQASATAHYTRPGPDGAPIALPSIRSPEGQEALRNWLACGAPVVERTEPRSDGLPNPAGFTVSACDQTCVDPTWPALYAALIEPSCATPLCHAGGLPAGKLDLSDTATNVDTRAARVFARLFDANGGPAPAQGLLCQQESIPLVTPGHSDQSLFYLKVADSTPACGVRMPVSSSLSTQRICALRAWIDCGACADASDTSCAECIRAARESCGAPATGMASGPCDGGHVTCPPHL